MRGMALTVQSEQDLNNDAGGCEQINLENYCQIVTDYHRLEQAACF